MQRGEGDGHIHAPEQEAGPDQAQMRHQHQGKQQRGQQRADVIKGEDLRDKLLEFQAVLQDAQEQRDFQPDQNADDRHDSVEQHAERTDLSEEQEQESRRAAAHQAHQQLDLDKHGHLVSVNELREEGANPHREEVNADNRRELGDRIAEEIAGQRARDQLINEPARRDGKDGCEQQKFNAAVGHGSHDLAAMFPEGARV